MSCIASIPRDLVKEDCALLPLLQGLLKNYLAAPKL